MTDANRPLLGIALMLGAMMMVPLLDLFAKLLSDQYPPLQVTWARFVFHTLWLLPLLTWQKLPWWRLPPQPGYQFLRSLMLTVTTLLFFICIKYNPIPNALTLLFVSPLIVALLAPIWLGESFDWKRGVAVLVGFAGVVFVLRPDAANFKPSLLLALGAGLGYALYILITRKLATSAPPLLTLFNTAAGGVLVLSPVVVPVWVPLDGQGLLMMAAMGVFAAIGHFMIILACRYATASQLSPFNYFEIVGAVIISYLAFGYFPDLNMWLGMAIIAASGAYVSWREIRLHKRAALRETGDLEKL